MKRQGRLTQYWAAVAERLVYCPGTVLLAGSAVTRFAIFEAGRALARDPRYTIRPQSHRLNNQALQSDQRQIT